MKRAVLFLILILSLQINAAATTAKAYDSKYELLSALGIAFFDNTTGNITRNEFIGSVCRAMSEETDEPVCKAAYRLGLVSGSDENAFRGEDYITPEEAAKTAVTALGYRHLAEAKGGYPSGYTAQAATLGLFDKTESISENRITKQDAAIILYNMINADIMEISGISNVSVETRISDDSTILSLYRDIYEINGQLTDNGITALNSESKVQYGKSVIGGTVCNTANIAVDSFFGKNVKGYVKCNDEQYTLLWIEENGESDEILVNTEDIIGADEDFSVFSYRINDRTVNKKLAAAVKVIYNGVYCADYTKTDFKPESGSVRLLDADCNGAYETVFITSYKTFVTDYVSVSEKRIYNKFSDRADENSVVIDDEDISTVTKITLGDVSLKLDSLSEWDVLMIEESKNISGKKYIGVQVVKNKITGTVQSISEADKKIVIDGTEYSLSARYFAAKTAADALGKSIVPEQAYTFLCDADGKIAAVTAETKNSGYEYEYLLKAAQSSDIDGSVEIRTMNLDGQWNTWKLNDTVVFGSGGSISKSSVYAKLTATGKVVPQLIAVKKNKDLQIIALKTALSTEKYSEEEFTVSPKKSMCYRSGSRTFQSELYLGNNVRLIAVPEYDVYDEESYSIQQASYLQGDTNYTVQAVDADKFGFADVFIIINTPESEDKNASYNVPFVVFKKDMVYTADNESRQRLTGNFYVNKNYTLVGNTEHIFDSVVVGDLINFETNNSGFVKKVIPLYSLSEGKKLFDGGDVYKTSAFFGGTVLATQPSKERIKVNCGIERNFRMPSDVTVQIAENGKVRETGIYDVRVDDYIVIWGCWGYIKNIMIVR